ncbi:hypothetical protein Mar181_2414 [Marinomonas posidonica IVIA-Po-181]|uniref:Uncharacterized protein n=1 Tax=Marinomonas posidonica (strain CECT 7376 / NCIMB 14433 / IVIA-Po-181) TaxID=491952 RepID=F6CW86_MARPP|nr:hypothetical protein Mar181_2414 [Marinomonas posidonica IVIA-Po-181]
MYDNTGIRDFFCFFPKKINLNPLKMPYKTKIYELVITLLGRYYS